VPTGQDVMPINSDGGATDTLVRLHNWCTKAKSSNNADRCIVQFQSCTGQGQPPDPGEHAARRRALTTRSVATSSSVSA